MGAHQNCNHYNRITSLLARISGSTSLFEIWDAAKISARFVELKRVSDEWLRKHHAKEKRFSLGRFDIDYLCRTPVAVIQRDGVVVAFANLWTNAAPHELSIDLMRYAADAPSGVMDCLFGEMLIWGKTQGYAWFNLGMAPLSGLSSHALAPLWHRLARVVFRRGRRFYNFSGLRDYKDKFHPEWSPRYLAVFGCWNLPIALADITALIGGEKSLPKTPSDQSSLIDKSVDPREES